MAQVTFVKKAQQRYATVPVIDPETGQPKITPVLRRDGTPKTTKHGRAITRRVTADDKTRPLPPHTCDHCHEPIKVGTPYKWIAPRSGPYGGRKLYRHAGCPTWQVWEYSGSLSARVAQLVHTFETSFDVNSLSAVDDVESALSDLANSVRELAQEKRESAQNIVDGFGHETSSSQELEEVADSLESWADDIENVELPDYPEPEAEDRWYVVNAEDRSNIFEEQPEGFETSEEAQEALDTYLEQNPDEDAKDFDVEVQDYTPDEPTDEQLDDWHTEVESAIEIVNECPV